jgi:hypothetical protein
VYSKCHRGVELRGERDLSVQTRILSIHFRHARGKVTLLALVNSRCVVIVYCVHHLFFVGNKCETSWKIVLLDIDFLFINTLSPHLIFYGMENV